MKFLYLPGAYRGLQTRLIAKDGRQEGEAGAVRRLQAGVRGAQARSTEAGEAFSAYRRARRELEEEAAVSEILKS